jgi:hypothetical protein
LNIPNTRIKGVCKIYEEHLKRLNPSSPQITYDISQVSSLLSSTFEPFSSFLTSSMSSLTFPRSCTRKVRRLTCPTTRTGSRKRSTFCSETRLEKHKVLYPFFYFFHRNSSCLLNAPGSRNARLQLLYKRLTDAPPQISPKKSSSKRCTLLYIGFITNLFFFHSVFLVQASKFSIIRSTLAKVKVQNV